MRFYDVTSWSYVNLDDPVVNFTCALRSQANGRGIWPGNETLCAHAYKVRKWRPSQRTATIECCEWLLLTRVNLRL